MIDHLAHLTESQRRAIHTIDRSVLVSAAAGSGKTTVLAERCAALVCDLPGDRRCRIDELLVLTFTDAAAAEMKSRIGAAIRRRLKASPRDGHLQEQIYLLESANISTIHSFCRVLIQRWFPQAGVDPQASVLSGEEALLLKDEVLDAFFAELYGGDTQLGLDFQSFVDQYSAGDDRLAARVTLQLHEFIGSLPEPDAWLKACLDLTDLHPIQHRRLSEELKLQSDFGQRASRMIRQCWPIAFMHAEAIDEHVHRLKTWLNQLNTNDPARWEPVAKEILNFEFGRAQSRPRDLSDEDKATFDAAKALRDRTKALFAARLQEACCSFTAQEYADGLRHIAPYVQTLTQLVSEFDFRYRQAKADRAAVDFNDLQRYAYDLLIDQADPSRPSAIARQLQEQYRYVLVDEFQDIDPLQEAIIRCVSTMPQGNLFAVGDIKQSIYRFRLAEPTLFTQRADSFESDPDRGQLIHLQENFRSQPAILDAINIIFRSLMSADFGGSNYDRTAELRAGRTDTTENNPAVAVHLIEPVVQATHSDDESEENGDGAAELEGIEREAFLIGRLIQQWMGDNPRRIRRHIPDKTQSAARPIEYGDIVILLRSMPHKAGPIADILRRMGLPVRLDRDPIGMDSTEVRDVVSLLQVLDNAQQDIPLAAVLRSPLLGRPFNETELLEIRLLDRDSPFYAVVQEYARRGPDRALRGELALQIAVIDRCRRQIQRTPVAQVLWEIYEECDYLSYVAGLPDGARRREHLLALHELARQFGNFTRQGLQRFLHFVEEMADRDRPSRAAGAAADENVVRIMTIHTSKGLEFPVVILADLQKSFNLTDIRSPVLLDRRLGIAMRGADPEKRILYPTLISQLAVESGRHECLSEELRVLYVALTRAREHLVLVGRTNLADVFAQRAVQSAPDFSPGPLPKLELETATHFLDWLLPALGNAPREAVQWPDQNKPSALFRVTVYDRPTTDQWRIPPAVRDDQRDALTRLANLQPLPDGEPLAAPADIKDYIQPLTWIYPATELTTVPARISVTELKRRWPTDGESDERIPQHALQIAPLPAFMLEQAQSSAAARGSATHRFLQLVDLTRPCDTVDLDAQLHELIHAGRVSPTEAESILMEDCVWFFAGELGERIRRNPVLREVPFVSRLAVSRYDPILQSRDEADVLLLRGMIDVLLRQDDGIELVDYKTDRITAEHCDARAEEYRSQLDNYTAAIEGIYRRPITHRWLVFLHARRIIQLAAPHRSA